MSNKLAFSVTLTFSDKITSDEDVMAITNNIVRAIESEVNHGAGISPDESDYYTTQIQVKPIGFDEAIILDIV